MTIRHIFTSAIVLYGFLSALNGNLTLACSCTEPSVQEAFSRSEVVFAGTVVGVQYEPAPRVSGTPLIRWSFRTAQWWKGPKGPSGDSVQIHSPWTSASCGVEFIVGQEYIVYASHLRHGILPTLLYTGLCSRTSLLKEAFADILLLPDPVVVDTTWTCSFPHVSVSGLVDSLRHGTEGQSRLAAKALVDISPGGLVEVLIDMLVNGDLGKRIVASWALAQLGSLAAPAASHLRKTLLDDDPTVRYWAERALKRIARPRE